MYAKALLFGFHTHQSACELSLTLLSSTVIAPRSFHVKYFEIRNKRYNIWKPTSKAFICIQDHRKTRPGCWDIDTWVSHWKRRPPFYSSVTPLLSVNSDLRGAITVELSNVSDNSHADWCVWKPKSRAFAYTKFYDHAKNSHGLLSESIFDYLPVKWPCSRSNISATRAS